MDPRVLKFKNYYSERSPSLCVSLVVFQVQIDLIYDIAPHIYYPFIYYYVVKKGEDGWLKKKVNSE